MLLWIEEMFSIWYDTGGTLKTEPEDEVENSERVGNREVCDQTQEDLRGNGSFWMILFLRNFFAPWSTIWRGRYCFGDGRKMSNWAW